MIVSEAVFPRRSQITIMALVIGMLASWVTQTPFGLLAPVTTLFLYARDRMLLMLNGILATALVASLSAILLRDRPDLALTWSTFFAVALCLGATVCAARSVPRDIGKSVAGLARRSLGHPQGPEQAGFFDVMHPEDRPAAKRAAARAFWTGVPQVMRFRMRQSDGSYRWSETRTDPPCLPSVDIDDLVSEEEQPLAAIGGMTEAAELDPIQAAKVVEELFGNAWAFDESGRWIYLPLFAQITLGKTPEELNMSVAEGDIGWKQLLHPDEYEAVAENWAHCLRSGDPFNAEFRIPRKSGFAWARSAARPVRDEDGRVVGWYGTSIDIDVYQKTASVLQERERNLLQLVDMVPGHLWRLSADGEPNFFNKRMIDYLGRGLADADVPGTSRLDAMIELTIHPDDATGFRDALRHSLVTGESLSAQYRLRRADGVYRWMASRAEPFRDQNGQILHWYGLCHDVDDHIRAEQALQRSERHLQSLVDALPIQVCSWTPDGEMTYVNKRYLDALGVSKLNFSEFAAAARALVHPDDAEKVRKMATHCLETGEAFAVRYRRRGEEGSFRWADGRFEARRDEDGSIVEWYGLVIDVDHEVTVQEALRSAQSELARASQAASLAELSASIAHEVAQPLAAVVSSSDACQRWLMADPPNVERARRTLERIALSANSAVDVVTRIRALFKHAVSARTVTAIGDVIDETCALMAEEAARRHVRCNVELADDLPPLSFDHVQIQQVLINLMRNAIEAMDAAAGERVMTVRAGRAEDVVRAEISDTGPGIEFPQRVFEPFFTTKAEGMGMGLAICRSIVESHGGRLWVEQIEPHGAKFIFTLPADGRQSLNISGKCRTRPQRLM